MVLAVLVVLAVLAAAVCGLHKLLLLLLLWLKHIVGTVITSAVAIHTGGGANVCTASVGDMPLHCIASRARVGWRSGGDWVDPGVCSSGPAPRVAMR